MTEQLANCRTTQSIAPCNLKAHNSLKMQTGGVLLQVPSTRQVIARFPLSWYCSAHVNVTVVPGKVTRVEIVAWSGTVRLGQFTGRDGDTHEIELPPTG